MALEVEPVDSPYGKKNENVPYGERVALALAKDAAGSAIQRAERWRDRCLLAERELGAVSDAADLAIDRLELPADVAAILLDMLAQTLEKLPEADEEAEGGGVSLAERRLGAALERERLRRVAAEGALQAEQLSHAKTRQRLVLAEGARASSGSAGSALVPRRPRSAGEPERRRQMATAEAAGVQLCQRRALAVLLQNRQRMLGVRAASLTWHHSSAGRALQAWRHARWERKIREHASLTGAYASLRAAVGRWIHHVRGDSSLARDRGGLPEPFDFESALLLLDEVE
ncbi:hypothetical protein T492DRAFT_966981 [Pavlovales sp. CCMP2436]|nr:hypothetical protein T492DRAFT_966981 [Pavlovales sp. CCMP2436]